MSSMLKKTGGLAFKPKAGRRPAAPSASQPPSSQTTSRAPTAEPSAQSQTPAPAPPVTPLPVDPQLTQQSSETPKDTENDAQADATLSEAVQKPATAEAAARQPVQPVTKPQESSRPDPVTHKDLRTATHTAKTASNVEKAVQASPAAPVPIPAPASAPSPAAKKPSRSKAPAPTPDGSQPRRSLPPSTTESPQPPPTPAVSDSNASIHPGTTSAAGLPSPAATAVSRSSAAPQGRPLSSPSPLPVSESITATEPTSQRQASGSAEAGPSTATPAAPKTKPKRRYVRRKRPAEDEGGENGEGSSAAPPKPKRQRRKKAPAAEGQEGDAAAEPDLAAPKRRRRQREPTPEHDEDGRPNHATTKLSALTRDLGIGKEFKHAELIRERQRQARHAAKMRKLERQKRAMGLVPDEEGNGEDASRAGTPATPGVGQDGDPVNRGQGIDFDIVDGQIIINQNSLMINQHSMDGQVELETVEEDEFTHLTTSASYMRPSKQMGANHWTDEDTEKFYHYLKMFGTDFETISHMFPGRNRRQVKLKFNREEKVRPNRINAAIMARGQKKVTIDLEDYKANRIGGEGWITQDKFRAETEQLRKEQEKELEAKRQERRDMGLLDDEPDPSKEGGEADEAGKEEGEEGEGGDEEVEEGEGEGGGEEEAEDEEMEETIEEGNGVDMAMATVEV